MTILIENYERLFKENIKYKRNVLKSGQTNEDIFQNRVVKLLENYINDLDYIEKFLKGNRYDLLTKPNDIYTNEIDIEIIHLEIEEEKKPIILNDLKLLFINYRPTKK